MCDLSLLFTIGSTVVGAAGAIQQGQAAASAAKYNAQIGQMNAAISERRAKDAIERGADEEQKKRQQVQQILGQQQAAMAANGVDLTFGSPLDTITDTAVLGELDALTIRTNSYREAYDYRVQASNQRAGAQLSLMEGKAAKTAGYLDAFGTILGGAGKAYQGYKMGRIGAIA